MHWIALFLPALPLQAFTRGASEAPALMAVVGTRKRVLAVSPQAAALGVQTDATVNEALAIAPQLQLKPQDTELERETLHALAHVAARFTPSISLDADDCVLLEVSACLRLFGGVHNIVQALGTDVQAAGLHAQYGTAPTPLAARWLAVFSPGTSQQSNWRSAIDTLPVHALACGGRVSSATLALLHGLGIRTLGELSRLPRDGLARRQARDVLDTLARACGDTPDPRNWLSFPPRFASRLTMPVPVHGVEPLMFACERLFAELAGWLKAQQAACAHCLLTLEHEHLPPTRLDIIPAAPIQDRQRWLGIARERLAALKLPAAVEALHLSADQPLRLNPQAPDLFGSTEPEDEAAQSLLERLRARLGADCVYSLQTRPDHRPEHAWRCAEPNASAPASPPALVAASMPHAPYGVLRPVWLLRQPTKLAHPAGLHIESGPERIETGWWEACEVQRDYYVARTPDNCRVWIFQERKPAGQWFVHGYFG